MSTRTSSRWIHDFEKQLVRGKHVVLHGNVHDQFLWESEYLTADDFLRAWFMDRPYEVVVEYDLIDGFQFPTDEMSRNFQSLVQRSLSSPSIGTSGSASPSPASPTQRQATPAGGRLSPFEALGVVSPATVDTEEAAARIRRVLRQNDTSVAVIFRFTDMSTSHSDRYSPEEAKVLLQLKRATLDASLIERGPRRGDRNTLVFVAGELKRVPDWLYRDNPFVSIVHAARPDRQERRQFAVSFMPSTPVQAGFYSGEGLAGADLETLADDFADLTDGMQAWDLEALRRTSHAEGMPVRRLRQLIDFFRFGNRNDPWQEGLACDKIRDASEQLSRRVIGQQKAIQAVTSMLITATTGITMNPPGPKGGRPRGVFFFVGPTGVGKTELAKALTEFVFGDEKQFERFDMSEYKEEHSAENLAGAPAGYVGYERGGRLTNRVLEKPHSILLFDEIEKAHPRVLDKFLQILEDGRLTDGQGRTAYFDQSAIIFTSNIGASDLTKDGRMIRPGIMTELRQKGLDNFPYEKIEAWFKAEVNSYFISQIGRAELLNRLGDNIVVFDVVRPEVCRLIVDKFLRLLAASALETHAVELRFASSVADFIEKEMNSGDNIFYGGRRVKTLLEALVERPLNEWMFYNRPQVSHGSALAIEVAGGKLEVNLCSK